MKLWLDDLRPVPYGYEGARSVNEAKQLILEAEHNGIEIEALDLDHDLGDYADQGGDAIRLLDCAGRRIKPLSIIVKILPGAADRRRITGGAAQSGTISLRGRLCDHTLLCQHAAGPDQCRDGTLLCPGSADGLSGDFGTEAALQALVFRPLSPGLSAR